MNAQGHGFQQQGREVFSTFSCQKLQPSVTCCLFQQNKTKEVSFSNEWDSFWKANTQIFIWLDARNCFPVMLLNKGCSPFQKRIWGLRAWLNHKGHNWKQQIAAANEASSISVLKWESERFKLGNGLPSNIRKGGCFSLECACTEVPAGCSTLSLSMKHSHAADCYYRIMLWNRAIMLQHIPFWSAS